MASTPSSWRAPGPGAARRAHEPAQPRVVGERDRRGGRRGRRGDPGDLDRPARELAKVLQAMFGDDAGTAGVTGSLVSPRSTASGFGVAAASGSGGANNGASGGGTERLADMPQGLLYPFYPEAEAHLTTPFPGAGAPAEPGGATVHTYDPLLRQAAALQGAYGTGAEAAHGDVARAAPHAPMWTHVRPPASQPAKPH